MEKFWRTMVLAMGSVLLLVLSLMGIVFTGQKIIPPMPAQEKTLPITAEGRSWAQPDIGQITFTVMTEGKTTRDAESRNAEAVNDIVTFLKEQGVKDADIKTSQFSLQPKYYYPADYPRLACPQIVGPDGKPIPCPPTGPVVTGYAISQSLNIKIRDLTKAGAIVAGAIERGANQVGQLRFSVEDVDKYKKEARENAFNGAKRQAEDLARLGGFKIGGVVSIQEGYSSYPRQYAVMGAEALPAAAGKSAAPPQIEAGSQEVVVTLTVVFKIG